MIDLKQVHDRGYVAVRDYSKTLFAGAHDVHTPQELVEEVLMHIPFLADGKKFLVLFNIEFVFTLVHTYGVNSKNITFYSDHPKKTAMSSVIGCNVITSLETEMKFDVVVGNPPYQKAKKETRVGSQGESALWDKFVTSSLEAVKDNGYVIMIHPNAWRKPEDRYGFWNLLTQENQMVYLRMGSGKGKQDWFKIGVRVDYYVVKKTPKYTTTTVVDHEDIAYKLDLGNFEWLPNFAINEISKLIAHDDEERVNVVYNTVYHTQRDHSDVETSEYTQKVVHTINKKGIGVKFFKKNDSDHGIHVGKSKVLLNQNEVQYPVNDHAGEFGMSQLTFGICIDSKDEGDELISFINSDVGKRIIAATKWNTYYTDYGMFKTFKKNFYK